MARGSSRPARAPARRRSLHGRSVRRSRRWAMRDDVDRAVAAAKRAFASFSQTQPAERARADPPHSRSVSWRVTTRWPTSSRARSARRRRWRMRGRRRSASGISKNCAYLRNVRMAAQERHDARQSRTGRRGRADHAVELADQSDRLQGRAGASRQAARWCSSRAKFAAQCGAVRRDHRRGGRAAGVFNLVNGDGPTVGAALCGHPDVDMVSFTGSTRAGVEIAKLAAPTVKRVHQELGGKSANILLDDADFEAAVTLGVNSCFSNSGQSCNAPTRMLVPASRHDEAVRIAQRAAQPNAWPCRRRTNDDGPRRQRRAIRARATADRKGHRRRRATGAAASGGREI